MFRSMSEMVIIGHSFPHYYDYVWLLMATQDVAVEMAVIFQADYGLM